MRDRSFDLYRYDLPLSEPVKIKGAALHRREGALLRLTADDGSEGWGEAAPLPRFSAESLDDATQQLRAMAPLLMGREMPASLSHAP